MHRFLSTFTYFENKTVRVPNFIFTISIHIYTYILHYIYIYIILTVNILSNEFTLFCEKPNYCREIIYLFFKKHVLHDLTSSILIDDIFDSVTAPDKCSNCLNFTVYINATVSCITKDITVWLC